MSGQSKRVFVGNLSYRTRWQGLKDHMRMDGQLNVVFADVMMERNGFRSKGCGIVEYETTEEAKRAIEELHDTELDGRKVFVREDREEGRPRPPPSSREYGAGPSGKSLFVQNLPADTQLNDLTDLFSSIGTVVKGEIRPARESDTKNGVVFFHTREEASDAIQSFDGTEFGGNRISVRLDRFTY